MQVNNTKVDTRSCVTRCAGTPYGIRTCRHTLHYATLQPRGLAGWLAISGTVTMPPRKGGRGGSKPFQGGGVTYTVGAQKIIKKGGV